MINPLEFLKNAQEIQKQLAEAQGRMAAIRATGSSGGGMVEVTLNGQFEAQRVTISPEALKAAGFSGDGDAAVLEDLLLMALRDANGRVKEELAKQLGGPGGIPGLGGFGAG